MTRIGIASHTSKQRGTYKSDHGTPEWVLDIVRKELDGIDLDLASGAKHNKIVHARVYYSKRHPCPKPPRIRGARSVFCNPPGPTEPVKFFWGVWHYYARWRLKTRCAFLLFNLDHWRYIENRTGKTLYVVVFRKRLKFRGNKHQANLPSALIFSHKPKHITPDIGHIIEWGPTP